MLEVQVFPLVPDVALPAPAQATTRRDIPAGYGVQEQCLPFTAANALGFLIKSPIAFGLCTLFEVPTGAHAFRSPLDRPDTSGGHADARVFYVQDAPQSRFIRNAFTWDELEVDDGRGKSRFSPVQPGISFFDREDQQDLFKLHLPYILHTPEEVDALFLPSINRQTQGLTMLSGLVETDWYAHPVNLIFRKPPPGLAVHIKAGDTVAQVIFLSRSQRRPSLKTLPAHARLARDLRAALVEWYQQRGRDRSVYKKLARSHHGRVEG
ncbi:MAG TPA: DUF6065 family protein [Pyrinomonadaceae bacterium]|jgi:hypothetical protein